MDQRLIIKLHLEWYFLESFDRPQDYSFRFRTNGKTMTHHLTLYLWSKNSTWPTGVA